MTRFPKNYIPSNKTSKCFQRCLFRFHLNKILFTSCPTNTRWTTSTSLVFYRLCNYSHYRSNLSFERCTNLSSALVSNCILINRQVYHSIEYDRKLNWNSYTVCYLDTENLLRYGVINKFFELKSGSFYCIIDRFDTQTNFKLKRSVGFFFDKACSLFDHFYVYVTSDLFVMKEIINCNSILCKAYSM